MVLLYSAGENFKFVFNNVRKSTLLWFRPFDRALKKKENKMLI